MDEDNQWARDRFERQVTLFDDWVHVDGVVRAPKNADRAVLLFVINQLPSGSRIHFDEVSLREISMP